MNLKNYTSETSADRSVSKIERRLVEIGAKSVNKDYRNGILSGIRFLIDINDQTVVFELPAKIDRVFEVLWKEIKQPQANTQKQIAEQAERTAWKIISDWVDIQTSMILLEQADTLQVFLPYAIVGNGKTLYNMIQDNGYKLLSSPK